MNAKQFKGRGFLQVTGNNMNNSIKLSGQTQNQHVKISSHGLQHASIAPLYSGNTSSTINVAQTINGAGAWINPITSYDFLSANGTHELLKKYEVYETTESILALSVTAKRLMADSKQYYKITDRTVFNRVTPEDRVMADQIKDYYSKKVMMWKLKGNGKLSGFREDMNSLIHGDMLVFKEKMIGIAYWLPYFYDYDIDMDLIKSQLTTNQKFEQLDKAGKPQTLQLTETLIPIKRLNRSTKNSKVYEYWFKDTELNGGVIIQLEKKNQLQHLWDYLFDKKEPLKIEGFYTRRTRDDFEFYALRDWNLKQD